MTTKPRDLHDEREVRLTRRKDSVRRSFSVESQMIGKLGRPGYGALRDRLAATTRGRRSSNSTFHPTAATQRRGRRAS